MVAPMLRTFVCSVIGLAGLTLVSCETTVDMPKGNSKGYRSARLIQRDPNLPRITDPTERSVHQLIQNSISRRFSARGLSFGTSGADLVVAYLVLYQEPGMTARYDDYFGYGRSADDIAGFAHERGAVENKRPDYFQRGAVVIDVVDARTNELIYRNYAAGDVVRGASDTTRAARIDAAVGQALDAFFSGQ
jgi:hypothetical protein